MRSIMAIPINSILLVACLQSVSALRIASGIEMEVEPESAPSHTLEAISNVNSGAGSVWIFHTTHNCGTSLSSLFEAHGFKWSRDFNKNKGGRHCFINEKDLTHRKTLFYDDICGEAGMNVDFGNFEQTFSRNSNKLLTIYPIRHPIHRNMAGDGMGTWKDYPDGCFTDNYGLRKLLGIGFDGPITTQHINDAKARAASFDIVMDMTNFTEGLETLCSQLGWSCKNDQPASDQAHLDKVSDLQSKHGDIYNKWVERNAAELEFYKFAKELSQRRIVDFLKIKEEKAFLTMPEMPSKPFDVHFEQEKTQWLCNVHK